MYKVTAIKNGEPVSVFKLTILGPFIEAVYYKTKEGKIKWDFIKDFDKFEITEEKP